MKPSRHGTALVSPSLSAVRAALRALADPVRARNSARYFKTGPGEYAEGDQFLGVTVPEQRRLVRAFAKLSVDQAFALLKSSFHEERLTALLILVRHFERGDERTQLHIRQGYLARTQLVNNWDLVDSSAPAIVGGWYLTRPRGKLKQLVRSPSLWERRIALLATFAFIRAGEADDALRLCEAVLGDKEDLIHKAAGWMLREVGQRVDLKTLREFLGRHAAQMPRTMLRYSIEKLPKAEQRRWRDVKYRPR